MRRASFITKHLSQSSQSLEELDENGNFEDSRTTTRDDGHLLSPSRGFGQGLAISKSFSNFGPSKTPSGMTSRPSFISLMLIASDDELSRLPRLPAPLQVETDTYQKCGWDDSPRVPSHLPVLKAPESDFNEEDKGILQGIIHLPERIRKISADNQRFNVYALPDHDRQQLKNLYVL